MWATLNIILLAFIFKKGKKKIHSPPPQKKNPKVPSQKSEWHKPYIVAQEIYYLS